MNRVQFALRVLLHGIPKAPEPNLSAPEMVDGDPNLLRGILPAFNPLDGARAAGELGSVAMSLMDPEVYGYLLVRVIRTAEQDASLTFDSVIHPALWAPVRELLLRLLVAHELHNV